MTIDEALEVVEALRGQSRVSDAEISRTVGMSDSAVQNWRKRQRRGEGHMGVSSKAVTKLTELKMRINGAPGAPNLPAPDASAVAPAQLDPRREFAPLGHNDMRISYLDGQMIVHAAVTKSNVAALIKVIEAGAENI
ncbi:MAG: hypothetical protein AAF092_05245 [Pseudomonadota bacterium]